MTIDDTLTAVVSDPATAVVSDVVTQIDEPTFGWPDHPAAVSAEHHVADVVPPPSLSDVLDVREFARRKAPPTC